MSDLVKRLRDYAEINGDYDDPGNHLLIREAADRIEELEARCRNEHQRFLEFRCMTSGCGLGHTVCRDCGGAGRKMYGSTATWRGGIGGQAFTSGICDRCWGSGFEDRPWISVREHEELEAALAASCADMRSEFLGQCPEALKLQAKLDAVALFAFAQGYNYGHNDTVESAYSDPDENAADWLSEAKYDGSFDEALQEQEDGN